MIGRCLNDGVVRNCIFHDVGKVIRDMYMVSWNSFESLDLYHGLTICRSMEAYKRHLRVDYTQIIDIVQQSGT